MNQNQLINSSNGTIWVGGTEFKSYCEVNRLAHESEIEFKDRLIKRSNSIKLANMPDRVHTEEIISDRKEVIKGIIYLQKQK